MSVGPPPVEFGIEFQTRGERQVERSLDSIVEKLFSARDASDVVGAGIGKLGKIFEVALPVALIATATGKIIEEYGKMKDAAEKGWESLKSTDEVGDSISKVEGQIKELNKEIETDDKRGKLSKLLFGDEEKGALELRVEALIGRAKVLSQITADKKEKEEFTKYEHQEEILTSSNPELKKLELERQDAKSDEERIVIETKIFQLRKKSSEEEDKRTEETNKKVREDFDKKYGAGRSTQGNPLLNSSKENKDQEKKESEKDKKMGQDFKIFNELADKNNALIQSDKEESIKGAITSGQRSIGGGGRVVAGAPKHEEEIKKNTEALIVLSRLIFNVHGTGTPKTQT